ncbi:MULTISPECIES: DUF3499 domain-containing protein [Occultella]|uniref:DUF3499 domain-containing protein n=1 Tax=Occultella TaxID=2828348 RepID=UPI0012B9CD7E|nr:MULTISPECIES: DUF3499 domain-containing protein [Occultella]
MRATRGCTRSACTAPAVATLTYVYSDSTAVLGPLATNAEPHTYDLCAPHAERLTVPRGWDVVRLATEFEPAPPSSDDLLALADAVREASRAVPPPSVPAARGQFAAPAPVTQARPTPQAGRRGHLRVVRDDGE